jgi:hypothetical protein
MSAPNLFSAPRRFDLFTVLVASAAYAVLFAGMKLLNFPAGAIGAAGALFAIVAVGQAMADGRTSPRRASLYAATLYWICALVLMHIFTLQRGLELHPSAIRLILGSLFVAIVYGLISGYLVGTLVAGVFLISYFLRTALMQRWKRPESAAGLNSSPWDESS